MLEAIAPSKPKRLSLNLDVAKPKALVRVKTLSGAKYIKPKFRAAETATDAATADPTSDTKTPDGGSFYADTPDVLVEDADSNIDSAVDFFSLPTPDLMKTFTGPNLKVNTGSSQAGSTPAANTPTLEGRSFAEETSLVIQHTGKPTPDVSDMFDRTPQLIGANSDSLSTPVVDPNQMQRNPLAGHVYGMAPPVSLSHDNFISSPVINFAAAAQASATQVEPTEQQQQPVQHHDRSCHSPVTTHSMVNVPPPAYHEYQQQDDVLTTSTSTYHQPMLSHTSTFTELTSRPSISTTIVAPQHHHQQQHVQYVHTLIDDASVPTVVQDFQYANSPSMSAPSPASVLSNDSSSFDSKDLLTVPGPSSGYRAPSCGSSKRKSSEGALGGSPKKPRLTKKQQFVELQQREQFLISDNENLRRRVEGMTEGCKKLKQMLMERMTSF